ncbi:hypothetical protein HK097_001815, partial [Rhizophlyctis rosea]
MLPTTRLLTRLPSHSRQILTRYTPSRTVIAQSAGILSRRKRGTATDTVPPLNSTNSTLEQPKEDVTVNEHQQPIQDVTSKNSDTVTADSSISTPAEEPFTTTQSPSKPTRRRRKAVVDQTEDGPLPKLSLHPPGCKPSRDESGVVGEGGSESGISEMREAQIRREMEGMGRGERIVESMGSVVGGKKEERKGKEVRKEEGEGEEIKEMVNVPTKAGILGRVGDGETLTFTHIGVPPHITKSLSQNFSITTPTATQKSLIPTLLTGRSLLLRDTTGSGKSLALCISILSRTFPKIPKMITIPSPIDSSSDTPSTSPSSDDTPIGTTEITALSKRYTSVLILVPTRELALQLHTWILTLANPPPHHIHHLIQCLIPDRDIPTDSVRSLLLSTPPKIIIGTPGRVLDFVKDGSVDLQGLQMLVVDEVDRVFGDVRRYGGVKERLKRIEKKGAGEELVEMVVRIRREIQENEVGRVRAGKSEGDGKEVDVGGGVVGKERKEMISAPKIRPLQVVVSSATLNSELRGLLKKRGIVTPNAAVIYGGKGGVKTLTHKLIVVGPKGVESTTVGRELPKPPSSPSSPPPDFDPETSEDFTPPKEDRKGALPDADPRILKQVVKYVNENDVRTALVFVHSSISTMGVVEGSSEQLEVLSEASAAADTSSLPPSETLTSPPPYISSDTPPTQASQTPTPFTHFLSPSLRVLVLTEYEARGLDLPNLTTVFILGPPSSHATYLHMAGRAGRMGRE